jgi:hypothetical protein
VLAIGEMDYLYNQEANSSGKPGQLGIGILHSNDSFPLLCDDASHSDGYSGVYIVGQQMSIARTAPAHSGGPRSGEFGHTTPKRLSARCRRFRARA